MDECVNKWMDEWMNGCMSGWMGEWRKECEELINLFERPLMS